MINNYPSNENMNLFEGFIFAMSRHKYSLLQMRIMFRIIEYAQAEIEGLVINQNMCQIAHNLRDVTISLPTSSVMTEGSKHYEQVHRACIQMQTHIIKYYDSKTCTWRSASPIFNVEIKKGSGLMVFSVAQWLWDSILDFSRGYRKLELSCLMSLRSAHSMKMYQLLAGCTEPITYKLDFLKSYFGVSDKYACVTDFLARVIAPARKEMKERCPVSFEYHPIKDGRRYTKITFRPYVIEDNKDQKLERDAMLAQIPASALSLHAYRYMRYQMDFSVEELAKNKALLDDISKNLPNVLDLLADINSRRRRKDGTIMGKGWIIAALKSEVAQAIKKRHEAETFSRH